MKFGKSDVLSAATKREMLAEACRLTGSPLPDDSEAKRLMNHLAANRSKISTFLWRHAMRATLSLFFGGVRVTGEDILRRGAKEGGFTVVLTTHRSHFDYMVMPYVYDQLGYTLPFIAAGDNLSQSRFLYSVFSRGGAFFLSRNGMTKVERELLGLYGEHLAGCGHSVLIMPEGRRSRDGKIGRIQLGMTRLFAGAALETSPVPGKAPRQVRVVTIDISYDRVWELASYKRLWAGGEFRKRENLFGVITGIISNWGRHHGKIKVGVIGEHYLREEANGVGLTKESCLDLAKAVAADFRAAAKSHGLLQPLARLADGLTVTQAEAEELTRLGYAVKTSHEPSCDPSHVLTSDGAFYLSYLRRSAGEGEEALPSSGGTGAFGTD